MSSYCANGARILLLFSPFVVISMGLENSVDDDRRQGNVDDDAYVKASEFRVKLEALEAALKQSRRSTADTKLSGSTYIRWGRTTCEGDARAVYRGYSAGGHHKLNGDGANFLCLHERPTFNNYRHGNQGGMGRIFGVEYEFYDVNSFSFSTANNDGHALTNKPASCVLCHIPNRSTNVMIPARHVCPSGWTKEYQGYVVSQLHNAPFHRSNYVCWDGSPETLPGGTDQNQAIIYPVEVGCGSLPCSTFIDGLELTCVVCSI